MQVNPNNHVGPVLRPAAKLPAAPMDRAESRPEFHQVAALNRALEQTPDVRTDRVDKAREQVGDVNYPPRETIQRIAQLLAINIDGEAE